MLSRQGNDTTSHCKLSCVRYVVTVTTVFAMLHLGLVHCLEEGNLLFLSWLMLSF